MTTRTEHLPGQPPLVLDRCGDGAAVVFLHGIGGNRTNWARQILRFGTWRLAAAPDFRGYGDSGDVAGNLDFLDFAEDVLRVLDHVGAERADLVGLSMSGLVAQAFYARHPRRVRSLTLAACRPGSAPVAPGEAGAAFLEDRLRPILAGGPAALAESLGPALLGLDTCPAARDEILGSLRALRPESYVRTLRARAAVLPFLDLGTITAPTLVLAGENDRVAPLSQMQALAAAIPRARFAMLPRTGHLLNIEWPGAFDAALSNFLQSVGHDTSVQDRAARVPNIASRERAP